MQRYVYCFLFLALAAVAPLDSARAASSEVGIVLMHGKWGGPQSLQSLAHDLASKGYLVSNAETAWSGRRLYDVDYPAALKEIEAQVKALRAKGAKRVVVAGQSLGANAAAAYASSGFDLDGLVAMSPGHFPESVTGRVLRGSIERAKSLVADNRGAESESFQDVNQGRQRSIRTTAKNYFSYFDPDGLGAMTKTITKLARPIPVLLVVGTQDPFYPESKAMFDSIPAHAGSRYVVLETDHFNMRNVVSAELLKWLDTFAQ